MICFEDGLPMLNDADQFSSVNHSDFEKLGRKPRRCNGSIG